MTSLAPGSPTTPPWKTPAAANPIEGVPGALLHGPAAGADAGRCLDPQPREPLRVGLPQLGERHAPALANGVEVGTAAGKMRALCPPLGLIGRHAVPGCLEEPRLFAGRLANHGPCRC